MKSETMYKLGGAIFLCLQGVRNKRKDKMPILWKWISGTRVVG